MKINAVERFNGTLVSSVVNLSFDATRLNTAQVEIQIGNRSYHWSNIIINHQSIGLDGLDLFDEEKAYTKTELNRASILSALGVVIASILTIPVIWKGVKIWRNKQGVTQW